MAYDKRWAAFEEIETTDLEIAFESEQHLCKKHLRRVRFSLDIWPRADTSTEKKDTTRD